MRPSVITAVESTGVRPFDRSIVSTVSIPSPEKTGGRRTSRQLTAGRAAWLPTWYVGSHADTRDEASAAWFFALAAAGLTTPTPTPTGVGNGGSTGSDDDETMRTVLPTMRAST